MGSHHTVPVMKGLLPGCCCGAPPQHLCVSFLLKQWQIQFDKPVVLEETSVPMYAESSNGVLSVAVSANMSVVLRCFV